MAVFLATTLIQSSGDESKIVRYVVLSFYTSSLRILYHGNIYTIY